MFRPKRRLCIDMTYFTPELHALKTCSELKFHKNNVKNTHFTSKQTLNISAVELNLPEGGLS
jgi:hypothetical protein